MPPVNQKLHPPMPEEPPEKVASAKLDLRARWIEFVTPLRYSSGTAKRTGFRAHLRKITRDPDAIDALTFCDYCGNPAWESETVTARGSDRIRICVPCRASWSTCSRCSNLHPNTEITCTLDGTDVCEYCRNYYYIWCRACNGYYAGSNAAAHDHSCCVSPQLTFTIRNNGNELLTSDTPVTIALPAGTISPEGLAEISRYLRRQLGNDEYGRTHYPLQELSYDLTPLGNEWQAKNGNYAKRLSAHAYKTRKIKLSPDIMSQVGSIARDHSKPVSVTLEVTRQLNKSPGYFYNAGSCWWNSYSESRCALKTNGGFGLRTFDAIGDVTGRAWVLPLQRNRDGNLVPTFNTLTPDAFVVFNGYGDLESYAAPRILASMAGWTYRRINFSCSPMYINAGGYLVASEIIAKQYTDRELHLNVARHSTLFVREPTGA